MSRSSAEFWNIMEANFPTATHDHLLDEQSQQQPYCSQDFDEEEIRGERIIAASYDERIVDYFMHGIGDEESLTAQLQREYDLTEQEAEEAIDRGVGQLSEVTDYNGEDYPMAN